MHHLLASTIHARRPNLASAVRQERRAFLFVSAAQDSLAQWPGLAVEHEDLVVPCVGQDDDVLWCCGYSDGNQNFFSPEGLELEPQFRAERAFFSLEPWQLAWHSFVVNLPSAYSHQGGPSASSPMLKSSIGCSLMSVPFHALQSPP